MSLCLNLSLLRSQPPFFLHFSPGLLHQFTPHSSPSLPPKTLTLTHFFSHGPSLLPKGTTPPPPPPEVIHRPSFSRTFDVSALQVPAHLCSSLEFRLRGHLLNWPRVRNVARVSGDDLPHDLLPLLPHPDSLERRRLFANPDANAERLSPVLYREKLAKTFNCRGFLKFRNLAKMSRPKKARKKKKEEGEKRAGKNDFAVVEVVSEDESEEEEEDLRGLIGDEFRGGRWIGPTRLLLLDERYANSALDELPEAVKAVLKEDAMRNSTSLCKLVQCKLTLSYDYWPMNEVLEAILPQGMIIPSTFETVGHIAHLNLRDELLPYKRVIAQVVLDKNKPKIQTVVNKIDSIQNDYRTMHLEVLAGNHSLVTTLVENGVRFHVDLAFVYWNSRLATERQRLVNSFTNKDIVCDVFSGVGPIAISAAKKVKYVYANDLNPCAVEYLERNVVLNKLDRKIEVYNMDGRRFIDAVFASQSVETITQVVMNLPNNAVEYLDAFKGIFRKNPRQKHMDAFLPKIHVYGFSKAWDPEFDFCQRIKAILSESAVDVEMHRVRLVAPRKWMLCASFLLPATVAFAK